MIVARITDGEGNPPQLVICGGLVCRLGHFLGPSGRLNTLHIQNVEVLIWLRMHMMRTVTYVPIFHISKRKALDVSRFLKEHLKKEA